MQYAAGLQISLAILRQQIHDHLGQSRRILVFGQRFDERFDLIDPDIHRIVPAVVGAITERHRDLAVGGRELIAVSVRFGPE